MFGNQKKNIKSLLKELYFKARIEAYIIWILNSLLLLSMFLFIIEGLYMLSFLTLCIIILMVIIPIFFEKTKIQLPIEIIFIINCFVFLSLFLGEIQNFYEYLGWWDLLLHGMSGILLGIVGFLIVFSMYDFSKLYASFGLISLFSIVFSISIGTLWEILEFFIDMLFNMNMQRNSLSDTMRDLILDTLGGILVSIFGYLYFKGYNVFYLSGFIDKIIKRNGNKYINKLVKNKKRGLGY